MTDSADNNPDTGTESDHSAAARQRPTAVYVISVAAELSGMHPQTLRIYERRGLVTPARTQGGNRRYSDADIAILRRISELTDEGMNLEGIRRVMRLEIENARLRAELEQARSIAVHAIEDAQRSQRGARATQHSAGNDLVPLKQAIAVFGKRASIFERDSGLG
jgi:MerR family transcriptional regulator/heat shock protein HspR